MRKTSHDGGDSTSITSGVENEIKKSAKPKKSSLKRKAPNFSQESDDTVIEPLLQREKEKSEPQSAKFFGNGKTDAFQNKESDNKVKTTNTTGFCGTTESLLSFKDSETTKTIAGVPPLHNYMNTNVFNTHDNAKASVTIKSQILVEMGSSKQSGYTPSPLIFTTAKIHTDAKLKHMEPVHVTSVPILSTIEVSVSKGGNITTNEKKISNGSSVINPVYSPMPISKCKEEKAVGSCFTTIVSSTINKDTFGNEMTVTIAAKLANTTTAYGNSIKISLPSTTSNSLLKKSNTNDKQRDVKDVKKEPMLPRDIQLQSKALNLDSLKNNVTVKTIPCSENTIDITTTSAKTSQSDKSQTQKLGGFDNGSVNVSSYNSKNFATNNETPTSQNTFGISNTAKNSSTVGNKQLQRQKTTTEEIIDPDTKAESNDAHFKNSSAKQSSSSHPKVIETLSITDELPNVSANNSQSTITKSSTNNTANLISKTTPILTTTKPTNKSTVLSNTVTSDDVTTKPSATSTISNTEQTVSPNTISTKASSDVSKTNTASMTSSTNATSKDNTSIPTSIVAAKYPEVITTMQTQPSISKTLHEKAPVVNASIPKTSATVSSDKSKTAKQSATVVTIATTISTQPYYSNLSSKNIDSEALSAARSAKTASATPVTRVATKLSSSTDTQVPSFKPLSTGPAAAVKATTTATLIPLSSTRSSVSVTSQSIISTPEIAKQSITAVGSHATTKTASTPGKPSTMSSSIPTSIAGVKSQNNNSPQVVAASKPSTTSIPKSESVTKLPKTSAGSSSTNVTVSTFKSPQETSTAKSITKDSAASVKKTTATKMSVATKSPTANSANKSVAGATTKISSSESSSMTSATKKPSAAVLAKTSSVTTSAKTPPVSTLTKTPGTTSSSSPSSATIKPTTTQVSKSVGIAGSSVPSSTPVLRPPESVKKAGSKSSENNKDSKVSKA